jgi:hypothetical protein
MHEDPDHEGANVMTTPSTPSVHAEAPPLLARVLTRVAKSGIYLVRGVPHDLQCAARVRAASDGTTLTAVLVAALREYAAGTWTPRRDPTPAAVTPAAR